MNPHLTIDRQAAGFAIPAIDFHEKGLNLHSLLVHNPEATFFMRVQDNAMKPAGIQHKDIIVVDRSLAFQPNNIVVASHEGEFIIRYLGEKALLSASPQYPPIPLNCPEPPQLWGTVSATVHAFLS